MTYHTYMERVLAAMKMDSYLEDAREHYFSAGGIESDIGPRDDPEWYWRRAAKAWRDKAEVARRIFALDHVNKALRRIVETEREYPQPLDRKRAAWAIEEAYKVMAGL